MLRSAPSPRLFAWAGLALLISVLRLHAAGDWQVPEAAIRYKLTLGQKPSHPSAGYYVHLPDGGILHGTTPATVVVGEDGKVIPSYLLWNNPESGFSIIFAEPGSKAGSVNVYIQAGAVARLWKPESGLTPSPLLSTFPGRDNIGAAQQLGKMGRVENGVHEAIHPGFPKAAFSIGGDLSGRPRPGAFYFLTYLNAPVAGSYWLAPFSQHSPCEILVDGNKITPKEHSKQWGGNGASVDFTAGLHRVEVFQTFPGTGPYPTDEKEGWLMYLAWRQPKEKVQKGVEARVVSSSEIAHSGRCSLTAVESRDGAPVAAAIATPSLCYWFENEEPLLVYDFSTLAGSGSAGVTSTWSFPDGATVEGDKVRWLFPGFHDFKVKLTVKSAQGASACLVPFFSFSTAKTSLDDAVQRKAFRDVLTGMLEAYPHNIDPVNGWSEAWWNNLLRTIEGGDGYPMLLRLFIDHFEIVRRKLTPAQLNPLEDLFLDLSLKQNPTEALTWLQKFYASASDPNRQGELRMREGELQMYYLGDRKQAESIFTVLASLAGEIGARAKIRLGDLALIGGDLNKATGYYADVQNRARLQRNAAPSDTGELIGNQLVQNGARSAGPVIPGAAADLKGGALQEVSLSENVRSLTEDGFYLEAKQALRRWETEFPLSKISSDYILRESGLYIKLEDWKRAQPMLEAYCREIDASSYLPDAASMLITCVTSSKAPPESIRDIIEKVKGRLKYHPVAAQLDAFLATAGKPSK